MFDAQATARTGYDHSPYVVVLQAASRGLTSHYLLMCTGRGVRGGGEHARVRHPGSVACIQVAALKSRGKGQAGLRVLRPTQPGLLTLG